MPPRIISYFLCGMRHPTTGISEGDLSRLTGSSSSTASCASNNSSAASSKSLHSSHSSSSSSSSSSGTPSPNGTPTPSLASSTPSVISATSSTTPAHLQHNSEHSPEKVSLKNNINTQHKHNNNNNHHHELNESTNGSTRFNSTYLPEIINPLEWQKSRKRKDRLDSTSSASVVDRKLQRSNSEELLPGDQQTNAETKTSTAANIKSSKTADTIRRVASEDFQRARDLEQDESSSLAKEAAITATDENDSSWANRQQSGSDKHIALECWVGNQGVPTKDMRRRARYETSPARSHRLSPIRHGNGSNKHRDSDDSECEHERRRSSERFCKTRAPPGRKAAGVIKKSQSSGQSNAGKYLPSKRSDENAYKYDLSSLKYERRGFISKKVMQAPQQAGSDHNDNNLIDFHQQQQQKQQQAQPKSILKSPTTSSDESITSSTNTSTIAAAAMKPRAMSVPPITSAQEALPWGRTATEDQAPVLSRRYATVRIHPGDSMDTAAKLSKVMPYPQQYHKQFANNQQLLDDMYDAIEPLNTFRGLTSLSSVHTSEVMQQVLPAMISYQSSEERMKQINKRMAALKKKLAGYEEAYEARLGFRPSQAERLNDKHMKHILAELSKLRKERHEIKTEPVTAMGMKVSGDMDETKKLEKMKTTLLEIEENLTAKRVESRRSIVLEELSADQLVQEKTAVQHGLLYFESLYGRPTTKDERDAARPLYDRYRQLKRLVSRSVVLSGSIAGASELPTILEHEAMVFEATPPHQNSSNNSTETNNSPTEAMPDANVDISSTDAATTLSSDDSTTTTTAAAAPTATSAEQADEKDVSSSVTSTTNSENVGLLSIDQLWEHFERTNEEKKLLKRSIREYELIFEEQTGRKMLKNDRRTIEETFAQYKEKKAKARLLQALIKKQIQR